MKRDGPSDNTTPMTVHHGNNSEDNLVHSLLVPGPPWGPHAPACLLPLPQNIPDRV